MRKLPFTLAILAAAGCSQEQPRQQTNADVPASPAQAEPVKGVDRTHKGKAAPAVVFNDPDGGEISLAEFKGVPVLVNLWASWCAPCVKELPTLDRLSQSHAVDGSIGIIAVSQDSGPRESVVAFLKTHKINDLGAYHDPRMGLSGGLGAEVLPTSVLFDAEGREVWRYVGDLDWTGSEAARLLAEAGVRQAR